MVVEGIQGNQDNGFVYVGQVDKEIGKCANVINNSYWTHVTCDRGNPLNNIQTEILENGCPCNCHKK